MTAAVPRGLTGGATVQGLAVVRRGAAVRRGRSLLSHGHGTASQLGWTAASPFVLLDSTHRCAAQCRNLTAVRAWRGASRSAPTALPSGRR